MRGTHDHNNGGGRRAGNEEWEMGLGFEAPEDMYATPTTTTIHSALHSQALLDAAKLHGAEDVHGLVERGVGG